MLMILSFLAFVIFLVILVLPLLEDAGSEPDQPDTVPDDLVGAELIGNEMPLTVKLGWRIVSGRCDQFWLTPDGVIIPVDTKRRARPAVFASDKLQLSLYAWLIRRTSALKDYSVSPHGYLRFPRDDRPAIFLKASLLDDTDTTDHIVRGFKIAEDGRSSPPVRNYRCLHCRHTSCEVYQQA